MLPDTHNEWEKIEEFKDTLHAFKNKDCDMDDVIQHVKNLLTTHSLAPKCTRCNNPFEEHHWQISHRGEHHHTGCLEKTPARVTMLIESTVAALRKEWARKVRELHADIHRKQVGSAEYQAGSLSAYKRVIALIEPDSST